MKRIISLILAVALVIGGGWLVYVNFIKDDNPSDNSAVQNAKPAGFNKQLYSIDEPGSLWLIVNKHRLLDEKYVPEQLDAPDMKLRWASDAESMQVATAAIPDLEALNKAAAKQGYKLMLVSAYRSATYQKQLYDGYVRSSGQEDADTFSARPGASEHQTGLAVDLGRADGKCEIQTCFGDTAEGKWLAAHAHEFGFVLRYLKDKDNITGYMYEPWHIRYVGHDLAKEVYDSNQTLEEFFGLEAAPDYL